MYLREFLLDLRESLVSQRARSLLGLVCAGVAAGAAALLLCALEGLQLRVQSMTAQFGDRLVVITPAPGPPVRGRRLLEERQVALLAANFGARAVSRVRASVIPTAPGGVQAQVLATDEHFGALKRLAAVAGRGLDYHDVIAAERNCVLNPALARATGWQVGHVVFLGNLPFTVVGIAGAATGGPPGHLDSMDSAQPAVLVPRSVPMSWKYDDRPGPQALDAILIEAPASRAVETTAMVASRLLQGEGFSLDEFVVATAARLSAELEQVRGAVARNGGAVVLLGFLLAGVAFASLMLSNLQERRWEIGLRRSLGATPRDIVLQFWLEAAAIAAGGAAATTLAVNAAVSVLAPALPWPMAASGWTLVLPVAMSIGFSILFSVLPIRSAVRAQPAVALREL